MLDGANVIGDNVALNVGNDLTVKSRQDERQHASSSESLTLGNTIGFSKSESELSESWTNSQTTLKGSNSINITTGGNTEVKGAVIAQQNSDGTDGGNLNINTGSLTHSDLEDSHDSSSWSVSIGVGVGNNSNDQSFFNPTTEGSRTDLSFSNNGQEKEQITRSTIGNGNINTSSDVSLLNRDITKAQEVTRDEETGGYDVHLNVDTAVLVDVATFDGSSLASRMGDAWSTVKNTKANAKGAAQNVEIAAGNLTDAVVSNATGKGEDGLIDDYRRKTGNQELALQLSIDEGLKTALDNQGNDSETARQELEKLGNKVLAANGIKDENVKVEFYNGDDLEGDSANAVMLGKNLSKKDLGGFYDRDSETIYLNVANHDGTNSNLLDLFSNELSHKIDHVNGKEFTENRQHVSNVSSAEFQDQNAKYGNTEKLELQDYVDYQTGIANQNYDKGNLAVGGVQNVEPCFGVCVAIIAAISATLLTNEALKIAGDGDSSEGLKRTALLIDEGFEEIGTAPYLGPIARTMTSPIEGAIDYFYENDSKLYARVDGKNVEITREEITNYKNYGVNGIMTSKERAIQNYLDPKQNNVVLRHNPPSGFFGDLVESGLGKTLGMFYPESSSMAREVSADYYARRNVEGGNNVHHSQGTIIGQNAMTLYGQTYSEPIHADQVFYAVGPAVNERLWNSTASYYVGRNKEETQFIHDPKDPVLPITSPNGLFDIPKGIYNGVFNMQLHDVTNPLYSQTLQ